MGTTGIASSNVQESHKVCVLGLSTDTSLSRIYHDINANQSDDSKERPKPLGFLCMILNIK